LNTDHFHIISLADLAANLQQTGD